MTTIHTATLEQVLGGRNLTGLVQGIRSGLPTVVPEVFLTPTRNVNGDSVEWFEVEGTRQLARLVHYGSPARARELAGARRRSATMLHSFEKQTIPAPTLVNLADPAGTRRQEMGRQEGSRQTQQFKQLFMNLRIAAVQTALSTGAIHFDDEGHLLKDGGQATISVDFAIPSGNRGNLTGNDSILGGTAAKWSASSSSIVSQVRDLKALALRRTGYPLAYAFYGDHVPGYLAANDSIQTWIESNAPLAQSANQQLLASGELAPGLLGLTWVPMGDAFFIDPAGEAVSIHDEDAIVFTPAPSPDWYELVQGSYPVPRGVAAAGNASELLGSLEEVYGMFSYAAGQLNPPSLEQFAGDTFLPLIKVPAAVFHANVHW